jgi:hypothetical protein
MKSPYVSGLFSTRFFFRSTREILKALRSNAFKISLGLGLTAKHFKLL